MNQPVTAMMGKDRCYSYMVLAVVFGCFVLSVNAAQGGGQFNVTATLQSAKSPSSPTIFCRTNPGGLAFGATVTVICSTGTVLDISPSRTGMPWTPMHGGAYRYILASRDAGIPGTIDSYAGAGTTTSWRVIRLANLDYLELMVGW